MCSVWSFLLIMDWVKEARGKIEEYCRITKPAGPTIIEKQPLPHPPVYSLGDLPPLGVWSPA